MASATDDGEQCEVSVLLCSDTPPARLGRASSLRQRPRFVIGEILRFSDGEVLRRGFGEAVRATQAWFAAAIAMMSCNTSVSALMPRMRVRGAAAC